MNRELDTVFSRVKHAFVRFEQVYLFGSSLRTVAANDVDLVLVYEDMTPEEANLAKLQVAQSLKVKLQGMVLDFTTLSTIELEQTDFLARVPHIRIKP